ncbi:hypothetical protein MTR67_030363 [Solanum verrucosum]|uniref:Uncharacterized protein n=1 Tax=Solanum verrucosum TaxID=315347 RepID=A0AAF0RAD6_SOLVR|nr:hypothetical protein MTR67_030363 [Solanum verrucosum]
MTIPTDDLIHIADGQMGYLFKMLGTWIANSLGMHTILLFRKDMEKLTKFRDAIKEKVDGAEREGYKPKPDVLKWLKVLRRCYQGEGPSIEGQSAATRNLNKILQLLEDDEVGIIMGGVGKTTLVKNLNNELLKTTASSSKLPFY